MLHTHLRLLVAPTWTNERSLLTRNRQSVTILHTSISTDPLTIISLQPYWSHPWVSLCIGDIAGTKPCLHTVHIRPRGARDAAFPLSICKDFLTFPCKTVICGYRYSPLLALCNARTTDSLYSNTPRTTKLRTVRSCTLQLCIETAGRVSHCTVPVWDRVRSDCCSGSDHGSLTVRSRSGKILFACI